MLGSLFGRYVATYYHSVRSYLDRGILRITNSYGRIRCVWPIHLIRRRRENASFVVPATDWWHVTRVAPNE